MSSWDDGLAEVKVLVVEDQPEVREMVRDTLIGIGIQYVFEAEDGRAALSFVDESAGDVDIIMCDWNMPKMSGVELLRQVRTVDPDVPFLMITGRSDADSVVEAKSSGVSGYISKPFSTQELEAKLRIILRRAEKGQ